MSTICDILRAAILQAAMQGSLTDYDGESWNESKIEDVCELCTGNSISENVKKAKYMKVVEGRNYIGTKDLLFDHSFNYENGVKIPFDEKNFRIANRGDILLCIEGGSAGRKIGILEEDVNYGNKLCRFSPNNKLNNRFLYFYIQSPLFQEQFSESMTGIIGGVSIKKIKAITIKYPDITEQKRIVEKVDELLARVADLEQSTDALASLKKTFPGDAKASLLQAAMQGKLTKQLPEDGNAEDLLEEIKAEKEKLPRKKKELTISEDKVPFEIPASWCWQKLENISAFIGDRDNQIKESMAKKEGKYKVVSQSKELFIGYYDDERKLLKIDHPVLVFGDHTALVKYINFNFIIGADGVKVISPIGMDIRYLYYALKYLLIGVKELGGYSRHYKYIKDELIPIPPLAEQKRIVERLDTLMQNINVVENLIASE